jgi:hypothetical protein
MGLDFLVNNNLSRVKKIRSTAPTGFQSILVAPLPMRDHLGCGHSQRWQFEGRCLELRRGRAEVFANQFNFLINRSYWVTSARNIGLIRLKGHAYE